MDCNEVIRKAMEGWGGAPLPAEVARHLRSCAACAAEREALDRLLDEAAAAPVPDPGEGYWAAFLQRVERRIDQDAAPALPAALSRRAPAPLGWLRVALPAAAAVLLAAASVLLLWRTGLQTTGPGLAVAEDRMEAALLQAVEADPNGLETIEDLGLSGGGSLAVETGGGSAWSAEAVEEAGDLAALFAGEAATAWPGWSEMDRLLEGLDAEQARNLVEELESRAESPPPAGA